jgi:23S rRNA (cytidine1920-2'-O)/16S rRNA (cytidine1409-2'-O)-methyltransferase
VIWNEKSGDAGALADCSTGVCRDRVGVRRVQDCERGHTNVRSLVEGEHRRSSDRRGYPAAVAKRRLDTLLTERGLFDSRTRAAAAVMAGEVTIGRNGRKAEKPGQMVAEDVELWLDDRPRFVSRGGIKLANALRELGIDVTGRHGLDVGASTGGFTDCMLQSGATAVTTLDVAYGELSWKLRNDPRVTVIERVNARDFDPEILPYRPDLVAIDVSFISLRKLLGAVLAAAAPTFDCLAMVKPQFELGKGRVGTGGVVREAADRRAALVTVGEHVRDELGLTVLRLVRTAGSGRKPGDFPLDRRGRPHGSGGGPRNRGPNG